jgi:Acyl-coenzyme A synthetases/AMP-(fatty) acid ligases
MLRGIYGDPERYKETYWSRFEGRYFAATAARSTMTATSGCSAASTTS